MTPITPLTQTAPAGQAASRQAAPGFADMLASVSSQEHTDRVMEPRQALRRTPRPDEDAVVAAPLVPAPSGAQVQPSSPDAPPTRAQDQPTSTVSPQARAAEPNPAGLPRFSVVSSNDEVALSSLIAPAAATDAEIVNVAGGMPAPVVAPAAGSHPATVPGSSPADPTLSPDATPALALTSAVVPATAVAPVTGEPVGLPLANGPADAPKATLGTTPAAAEHANATLATGSPDAALSLEPTRPATTEQHPQAAAPTAPGTSSSDHGASETGAPDHGSSETTSLEPGSPEPASPETGSSDHGASETGSSETGAPAPGPAEAGGSKPAPSTTGTPFADAARPVTAADPAGTTRHPAATAADHETLVGPDATDASLGAWRRTQLRHARVEAVVHTAAGDVAVSARTEGGHVSVVLSGAGASNVDRDGLAASLGDLQASVTVDADGRRGRDDRPAPRETDDDRTPANRPTARPIIPTPRRGVLDAHA